MSVIADTIEETLDSLFPHLTILKEQYVNYEGVKLFFDFFVKEMGVYIEVQGEQHYKFVGHFHGDADGFRKQKYRDNLKLKFIQEDRARHLIRFKYNEVINRKQVAKRFVSVFDVDDRII